MASEAVKVYPTSVKIVNKVTPEKIIDDQEDQGFNDLDPFKSQSSRSGNNLKIKLPADENQESGSRGSSFADDISSSSLSYENGNSSMFNSKQHLSS